MNKLSEDKRKEKIKQEEDRIETMMGHIESSLDPKYDHLINICRPINGNAEIDVAILKAFLKSTKVKEGKNKYETQLMFALTWNRIDIARSFIFTDENKEKIGSLDSCMYKALKTDRVEFVELFLEKDFSIKNFLTKRVLLKLYNDVSKSKCFILEVLD